MKRMCIVVGTRPEIIKMSPVVRYCEENHIEFFLLHTGQHYSYEMDKCMFRDLELPDVKYNLDVGSGPHGEQTAKILQRTEEILSKERPDVVLVQGDTNSVLAAALAASKMSIKVGHVEAGLRSYDRSMPEETNRVLTDHISDFLFCPTHTAKRNVLVEGIDEGRTCVSGNTIVDAVFQNVQIAARKSDIMDRLCVKTKKYILVTAHRQENVDHIERLQGIITALDLIFNKYKETIIYPMHPRTGRYLTRFKIQVPETVTVIEPLSYLDFLCLEANARLILTDSGGVQEESCIHKVPCVTLRKNTERPETIDIKSNIIAGTDPENILYCVELMLKRKRVWGNPFGDGKASRRIVGHIKEYFDEYV